MKACIEAFGYTQLRAGEERWELPLNRAVSFNLSPRPHIGYRDTPIADQIKSRDLVYLVKRIGCQGS